MTFTNGHGKEVSREIDMTPDIRKFRGTPGHALLIIAANRHLSVSDLWRLLGLEGIERSWSWIQRRRWLFQDPDTVNGYGPKPNADGKDSRAIDIMRDNTTLSARQLSRLLKDNGISRNKDWVQKNRCR